MRDIDLTTLRLFVAVCDDGSMSRAAERAAMVASAVSKRMAQLEDSLGTPLLVRRRHGVVPTAAGQTLLEHARSMLLSAQRIERDMAQHAAGLRGRVYVLASASAMAETLADQIAAFLQMPAHRDIQVDLEERPSAELVRGVRAGEAAIGICWDVADSNGLRARTYAHDHLVVAVPRGHPLAALHTPRFTDVLAHDMVCMQAASAVQQLLQREAMRHGQLLRQRVFVSHLDAALRVVRAGLAVAIVPREACAMYAHDGSVALLALDEPWARRRLVLLHRGEDTLSPPAELLLDFLTQAPGAAAAPPAGAGPGGRRRGARAAG